MQNRFRAVLGARGRLGDAPGCVRNGAGTPSGAVLAAKLAVLAAKLVVRGDNLAVSSARLAPWDCLWALVERVARANPTPSSVRNEFSLDVGTIATSRKLEIRAPTQCFVRVRRSCRSVRARSKKHRRNCRFGLENRAPERPGSVPGAPERAKSSGKTRMERNRTAERILFWQSSEQGATQGRNEAQAQAERGRDPRAHV